jgi:hypothetical protein
MPVKQIGPRRPSPAAEQLIERLAKEWVDQQSGNSQPIILEERDSMQRLVHVYVVWDEWESLAADERAEIVLDACAKAKGPDAAVDLTVAMGLTRTEADRLRIPYR